MDEISILATSIKEMREEVKDMRSDVNKLVAIEERVAAVLRQSESNSGQIVKIFEVMAQQSERIAGIDTTIAVNGALDNYNSKLVRAIVGGVIAIVTSIVASNFI
jgi:hypothetical protein